MKNYADDIEQDARDMIGQFGDTAALVARERSEIADQKLHNQHLAEAWRDIADAIERLSREPQSRKPRKP